MTHGQLTRRITAIVSTLNNLSSRLDKITQDAAEHNTPKGKAKPVKAAKAPKAAKPAKRASAIGASIVYGGENGKVIERKGNKFLCEMANGKRKQVSAVYVYRQLSKKAKPQVAQQEQPVAPTQPGTLAHAEDVANTVIGAQLAQDQQKAS